MVLCGLAAFAVGAPAKAAWLKAETDRFIVYGDAEEGQLRQYATKLSAFDQILRLYNPAAGTDLPVRKFEVFLVRSHSEMERLQPGLPQTIAGFYRAAPRETFAIGMTTSAGVSADEVLLHEYAHHFMLENFPAPYPMWFVEGWADYFCTAKITPSGFQVGAPDANRVAWLFLQSGTSSTGTILPNQSGNWLPIGTLLTKRPYETGSPVLFYSQAWLLTHYMFDTSERAAQLNKATLAIAKGGDPVKAMEAATGMTADQLTAELRRYRKIHVSNFSGSPGPQPKVTVTPMPEARVDFMLDRLRIFAADLTQPDVRYLADIRARAGKAPQDEFAQLTLALAEYAFGDPAAGEAIVKAALDAHTDDIDALAIGGLGNMVAGDRPKRKAVDFYRAARPYLAKAYGLDKSDYRTLFAYAAGRGLEPTYPNDNDLNALLEAHALAPSVQDISLWAGAALMKRDRSDEAKPLLAAVANDPHDTGLARVARDVLAGKSLAEAFAAANAEAAAKAKPAAARRGL